METKPNRIFALLGIAGITLTGCAGASTESALPEPTAPTVEAIATPEPSPVPTDPTPRDEQAYLDGLWVSNVESREVEDSELIELGDLTCEKFDETGDVEYVLDFMYERDAEGMNGFGLSIAAMASTYLCSRHGLDVGNYVLEHDDVQVTGGMYGDSEEG